MWRWGQALLTLFLFVVAYIVVGLRFLQLNQAEITRRATPVNPNPEPDLWNWSVLDSSSILFVIGILALLILNLAGRTYRQVQRDNLNLQVKSLAELRKARGSWADGLLYFNYLALVVVLLGMAQVIKDTEFDPGKLISKLNNLGSYVGGLL